MKPTLVVPAALAAACLCLLHLARADDKNITSPSNPSELDHHNPGSSNTTKGIQNTITNTTISAVTSKITTTIKPIIITNTTAAVKTTVTPVQNITTKDVKPTTSKSVPPDVTVGTPKSVLPSSVTVSPKAAAAQASTSGFSPSSFLGGIVLTLGLLAIGYVGCRTYHAKRGVQYRTIDEHDAII